MWAGQEEQSGRSLKARLFDELCKPEVPSSRPKAMKELIPSFILEQVHPQAILSGVPYSLQSLVGNSPALEAKDVGKRWIKRLEASHYMERGALINCREEESPGMEDCALWRLHSHPTHWGLCVCAYVCACTHMCVRVRAYAYVCTHARKS